MHTTNSATLPGMQGASLPRVFLWEKASQKIQAYLTDERKMIVEVISQLAVRILFVLGSILMGISSLPVSFFPLAIPLTAIGTAFLSAFFFQPPLKAPKMFAKDPRTALLAELPNARLQRPHSMPPSMPVDAPRGIPLNGTNNCSILVIAQTLFSEPQIRSWVENMGEQLKRLPYSGLSVQDQAVLTLYRFFCKYQRAVQSHQTFVNWNPQKLRKAVHRLALSAVGPDQAAGIHASSAAQEDASEVWNYLLNLLPAEQKILYKETSVYDRAGLPAPSAYPHCGPSFSTEPRALVTTCFPLNIKEGAHDSEDNLPDMIKRSFDQSKLLDEAFIKIEALVGGERREVSYPRSQVVIRLEEAPVAFRFLIKRYIEVPPNAFFERFPFFRSLFSNGEPNFVKLNTRVQVPGEFDLRQILPSASLPPSGPFTYQLTSFFKHEGNGLREGHFIAYRRVGNQYYKIDNHLVVLQSQEDWLREAQQGYGLTYLRTNAL